MMNLEVRTEGVQITENLREHVERKLSFALGRFGDRIRNVRIRLKDVNGPRGGEDILCNVEASLHSGGTLRITEMQTDPFSAVSRAGDRLGRLTSRHLKRIRQRRRAG